MTNEVADKIVRGITDKIECNTVDIDDWAEFWGFTREEYEEFLDTAIKALKQKPKTGHWIKLEPYPLQMHEYECSECGNETDDNTENYCSECGAKMEPPESEE
jgi:DNA-directed RNA polymerase subunit RPC12/RpoP